MDTARQAEAASIPVIDFGPFLHGGAEDRQAVARAMRQASADWGFFYLSNHGVPADLLRRSFQASQDFFALPEAEKQSVAWQTASSNRGYVAVRRERLDASKPGDLKEAFNAGPETGPDDLPEEERPYRLNRWPAGHPAFRATVMELMDGCVAASNRVLSAFALALDLPDGFFVDSHDQLHHTLRLLHYPPLPEGFQPQGGERRAGAHTDYGSITLLFQDGIGGLEVRTRDGEWITAPPIPDTVVVNTGDLMQRWTNHVFCSTPHRVSPFTAAGSPDRYSIAFFCHPNPDAEIRCIESCADADNPPRYPPILAGDHLMEKLNATY
ncbi:isopenicillin N synthase family dioxygenase [Alloalcanivorax profundimaris]|uniref:isopenicillin N synthase family dioxygenase n=1 Tax=Alloalcanivorax profundimaris TaxID=2735259 RepID=UPI000C4466DA|nr:isopenicillin N synthase family oxygenase [Alloalcanivorax profundimaris]MBU59484.1 2OG-Fe(II) oxygenase [Alcanivorax sp.]MCQ6262744.1 2OG-Fe(II) oxygenase [Alcanivorax sp. MM125-6]QJX02279.1 isopenicillin N synthase family oxygenase [Alcanivorax sp. IO_7]UWN49413.1 2-oxoglutarate-dependent ethylene/succinate-forming enzyme [Alcanivorax sp. ALC70]MBF1801971.1 isopenicillin N synthase family oxygenase [Alloalcanivorax profundimaris]